MKQVVRITDLKNFKGESIFEVEDNGLIKEAAFYLSEQTKDLSDDEYIDWLKKKQSTGFFMREDQLKLEEDLFQDKRFLFMQRDLEKLPSDIVTVLDLAVEQNDLKDKEYKHLIDSYY